MLTTDGADALFGPDSPPDDRPTFAAAFSVVQDRAGHPTLFISFRCPRCRRRHDHTWGLSENGEQDWGSHPRQPHCTSPAYYPLGYRIQPADTQANRATYDRYAELLRVAERRAAARAQLAGRDPRAVPAPRPG